MSLSQLLQKRISVLANRQQRLSLWCQLATCWAGAGLIGLCLVVLRRKSEWHFEVALPLVVLVAAVCFCFVVVGLLLRRRGPVPWRELARQIEKVHTDLDGRLLTAVQQETSAGNQLNFLQQRLLLETLHHSQNHDWAEAIPQHRLRLAQLAHWLALALFALVILELRANPQGHLLAGISVSSVTVTPGDTSIERGNSLVVLARFKGPLPATVELVVDNGAARIPLVKSLADPVFGGSVPDITSNFSYRVGFSGRNTRAYSVNVFEYPRLERSDIDLTFPAYTRQPAQHVENSRRLSAVEGSSLDLALQLNKPVASARLIPKSGQHRPILLQVQTNRPVATLKHFPLDESQTFELQLLDSEGRTNKIPAQFVFDVLSNRPPELKLVSPRNDLRPSPLEEITFEGTVWDDFGVEAYGLGYMALGQPAHFIELGQAVPGKQKRSFHYLLALESMQIHPDELISWFLWADDLGPDGAVRRTTGDLFFAEIRPFEEVFREGQGMDGQGQGGGEQSGGNQTARLADLQKQIISATWNLQRRQGAPASQDSSTLERTNHALPRHESKISDETFKVAFRPAPVAAGISPAVAPGILPGGLKVGYIASLQDYPGGGTPPSTSDETPNATLHFVGQLAPADTARLASGSRPVTSRPDTADSAGAVELSDVRVVLEAQEQALAQAEAAAERARDARFVTLWNAATKEMANALSRLRQATNSPASLKEALAAEQAAYQALLKLQEHEYQVSRSRSRNQGGSGRQQQLQRQLEEMELTQSENRYENQRQAQAPQASQRHEQLQVMNRLQELARRQRDLNDRLKELQTALQEAKTAEERAELQRRLKRLQEEEQQMLADVDELRQRMDRPENQSRMAEERRQLDQTREDVQRAADAAAKGEAAQALSSGTRAQRQLQQLRDQLRKENSSQFADDLRSMRGQARELARQQQEIQKGLRDETSADHRSLSAPADHKELLDALSHQRELMTNLLDRATQVSQQAESSEPLLSSQLYDAVRKFTQDSAKNVQELQEDLLSHGLMSRGLFDQLKDDSEQDGAKLLDISSEMLHRDFLPQASEASQRAGARLDELKTGVERAAESVLGDDTEALRLAKQELDQLTDELQREMAGAGGSGTQTNQLPARNQAGGRPAADDRLSGEKQLARGEQASTDGRQGPNGSNQSSRDQDSFTPGAADSLSMDQSDNTSSDSQQSRNARGSSPGQSQTGGADRNRSSNADTALDSAAGVDAGGAGGGPWNFDRFLNDQAWRRVGPITGEGFVNWSDRLRELEEIIEFPDLRTDVATARERARLLRLDYRRDHKKPDWAVVRLQVINPLAQVRDRIAEELARRQSNDNLVPIDRDPVPTRYSDLVRHYYEELGKEK